MKLATFRYNQQRCIGIVDVAAKMVSVFDLTIENAKNGVQYLLDLLSEGSALPKIRETTSLDSVELEAPLPRPRRNIFCAGKNYLDHVKEVAQSALGSGPTSGSEAPAYPIIFTKVPESVIAPQAKILRHASLTNHLDYEAELAIVIGKKGRGISRENAMEHVWGYTIINDVSARDLQKKHQQWHIAKSLDSFCPMGPWLVSKDEFDGNNTAIRCWVNDELRQDSSTSLFIFDIPALIESLSAGITLYPGDIIATGTPSGVGMGFNPPRFLQSGDKVKIEIAGIGVLENVVE
jgi:2-keto-4-pentenoate hydratase/2-oxohepta-3-ene-1,7-dioic acid hydratase in catechol pathway